MANIAAQLVYPLGDGTGPSVDTSTMGPNKIVIVKGTLQGRVNIEISHDDITWISSRRSTARACAVSRP